VRSNFLLRMNPDSGQQIQKDGEWTCGVSHE
jgi:hypothetical protein